jgi:hypothetical protein
MNQATTDRVTAEIRIAVGLYEKALLPAHVSWLKTLMEKLAELDVLLSQEDKKAFYTGAGTTRGTEGMFHCILPQYYKKDAINNQCGELVNIITNLADKVIVSEKGDPRWAPKAALESFGYKIVPGETETSGWITGVIIGKNFRIEFD